jgi:octaprenyl-diphosphate synthase
VKLSDITRPVERELERFDPHFREAMRSNVAFVDIIVRYVVRQKGKRIRPALVFLCATACGEISEQTYRGASLVEILHTATLIHDDVVDDADTRRGLASINAVWKNKIAVLMGDYLLAKGLLLSLNNDDFQFLKIISESVRRMSEGEILQIAKTKLLNMDEKTYLQIISDKTASLLSTCCQIGAQSVTKDKKAVQDMKDYGENLGMVFQIRDDLLDYVGRKSITGKPTGLDLKEKKLTLPMIYSLGRAPGSESRRVLRIIKNGAGAKDLDAIVEFAREHGGIEYSMKKAEEYSALAHKAIERLGESPAKTSLADFIGYVMDRTK